MRVAVLALQGGFSAHGAALQALGHRFVPARTAADLDGAEGLVLPGGESTAQRRLLDDDADLVRAVLRVAAERPVLATCAGLILAVRLGLLPVALERNGWGSQLDSFEALADDGAPLVLIRAPRIRSVGEGVSVERTYRREPVLVRARDVWGATYHPELSGDLSLHARVFGGSG
jgi:5'-phosphate synthase pdxT subunit